jgi:hypothetical protein
MKTSKKKLMVHLVYTMKIHPPTTRFGNIQVTLSCVTLGMNFFFGCLFTLSKLNK